MKRSNLSVHSHLPMSVLMGFYLFLSMLPASKSFAEELSAPYDIKNPELNISVCKPDLDFLLQGKITDEKGSVLPGVNILVKGTQKGTSSDAQGHFSIVVPDENTVVVLSFVGYATQEIVVGRRINLDIVLKADEKALDEIVVVGYGSQKKRNLTGAIATVDSKSIQNRPVTTASAALAGLAPGVSVRQTSGDPRADGATIRIRGIGTLNNSAPLFLVDGIQVSSIDNINPNDIESISLLKDAASASIYGALGANGVVLVTTKKGTKGKTNVSYNGLYSIASPSNLLKLLGDSPRYMRLVNQAAFNLGRTAVYNASEIEAWETANKNPNGLNANGVPNYVAYPNTDWFDYFEKNIVQNHNISVSGGGEKSSFLVSVGYLDNPGTLPKTGVKRYQLRMNVEAKPVKFLTLGTQTFASVLTSEPGNASPPGADNYASSYFQGLASSTPTVYPRYQGKWGGKVASGDPSTANNVLRNLYAVGGRNLTTRINSTLYANANLYQGLSFESRFNYQTEFVESNSYGIPQIRWNIGANIQLDPDPAAALPTQTVGYSFAKGYTYTLDEILRYNTAIGTNHEIEAFVGYNQYYSNNYNFNASKQGLLDYSIYTFEGATTPVTANGNESDRAMRSFFGRLNYSYKNRYILNGDFRRDGTSQFASSKRWGTFSSFSAGWIISEENFFFDLKDRIKSLKLSGSWGSLGNNRVDDYAWQPAYGAVLYSFNATQSNGVAQSMYANPALRWETTRASNIAMDAALLNGNLDLRLEAYKKRTFDILTRPDISLTSGSRAAPFVNGPEVLNKGVEFSANWRKTIRKVHFYIGGNFSYNKNEVTKYKGKLERGFITSADGKNVYTSNMGAVLSDNGIAPILEGNRMGDYFLQNVYRGNGSYFNSDGSVNINGGPKDGMIRTQSDMDWIKAMQAAKYMFQPVNSVGKAQLYYGDLIYADNNKDGIYGNTHDRVFMGVSANPTFLYGFNLGASWKGLDISLLVAGASGMKYYWNQSTFNNSLVNLGTNISERLAENAYYFNEADPSDPANRIGGSLPRLKFGADATNGVASDYWLTKAAYLRLKNIQVGYNLPQNITQKACLSNSRIFLSAENLLTISKFIGIDPEVGANVVYPTMKQIALGLNFTF